MKISLDNQGWVQCKVSSTPIKSRVINRDILHILNQIFHLETFLKGLSVLGLCTILHQRDKAISPLGCYPECFPPKGAYKRTV